MLTLTAYTKPNPPPPCIIINNEHVQLVRCVGRGATADVISAFWAGRTVVVKFFRPTASAAARMRAEAEMLALFLGEQRQAGGFYPGSVLRRRKQVLLRWPRRLSL